MRRIRHPLTIDYLAEIETIEASRRQREVFVVWDWRKEKDQCVLQSLPQSSVYVSSALGG